jgi:PmbA protein
VSSELSEIAARIVDRARGDEDLEAFLTHQKTFSVKAYQGEAETVESAEPRGTGVRVFNGGRVGFSYTTDLTDAGLDDVVEQARANAQHSTPDEAAIPAPAWVTAPSDVPGTFDASHRDTSAQDKVAFAIELETTTRAADPRIRTVEEAVDADSESEVAIATTKGIAGSYVQTDAWCYSYAIATEGDDTQVGLEFDVARALSGLDAHRVAESAARRAAQGLGGEKIPSARMPVVFEPYTAGQFLGVVAQALIGEAVQKGRSLFAGKLGEKVGAQGLTLIDDGRIEGALGSTPWDGEGVPTGRTEIISDGVLRSFLYDVSSGHREGRASTGNASRAGFKSPPSASPTNLAFDPTGPTRDDVLRSAGRALLVTDFHGVHSGANAVSGDFSVGATGFLVEDGVIGQPVKEVTIAAPMLDILARITAVADDRRWLPFGGSFGGATTLVSEMTVGGR